MQFKGSLRSPGDRGPGIRVTLEVDEYHLQIRRGTDLMGRWYLADVEVVRDIAERFALFLGDDELEFLADDALVFAYEGVTRMQQGWLNAQKKKRRHRKAAAQAARRKDQSPEDEPVVPPAVPEPSRRQPTRKPAAAPTSELARKLAAIAAAEEADQGSKRFTWAEAEDDVPASSGGTSFDWATAREEMAVGRRDPEPILDGHQPAEAPEEGRLKRRETPPAPALPPAPWLEITPAPTTQPEPAWIEPLEADSEPQPSWVAPMSDEPAEPGWPEPSWITPEETTSEGDLRRRYEAIEEAVRSNGTAPDEEHTEDAVEPAIDEPRPRRGFRQRDKPPKSYDGRKRGKETLDRPQPEEATVAVEAAKPELTKAELRMDGHHPIESNTGLLGKLRRAPKVAENHVHVYQESRSTVGLTRRVCIECSHVSISTDD